MPSLLQDANCWSFGVFIFSFGWAQTQNAPIQHGAVAKYSNRCAHWDFHPELSVGTALYMPVSLFMAVSTAWLSVCSWLCMAVTVHDCIWLSFCSWLCMAVSLFMTVHGCHCSWLHMAVILFMTVHGCRSVHDCAWLSVCSWLRMAISLFMIAHGHQSVHDCAWPSVCSWLHMAVPLFMTLSCCTPSPAARLGMYAVYKAQHVHIV